MKYQKAATIITVALLVVFCAYILQYESESRNRAQERIKDHGRIVADALWNYNTQGAREYLKLAAETDHYAMIRVIGADGQVFLEISGDRTDVPDGIMLALGLIPKIHIVNLIEYKGKVIGRIEASWRPRNIYFYMYILMACGLVIAVVYLNCRILQAKNVLEDKVNERTAALAHINTLLTQEILERKKAEDRLRHALQEKEILLKEIHHRVKNNMQVIISLLRLQAGKIKDEGILGVYQESEDRVSSMALVHESLYQSGSLAEIDFAGYATKLAVNLISVYSPMGGGIDLEVQAEGVILDIDQAIPCGLIINELVTNSLKYAFPPRTRGKITIKALYKDQHIIEMSVADNGQGLPAGLDPGRTDTLGLTLVNTLARKQLKAEVEFYSQNGTVFRLTFKTRAVSQNNPDRGN